MRIWDLDRLEARYALRGWLTLLEHATPYRKIAQRSLGRFVVLYRSPPRLPDSGLSAVWLYTDLDALQQIIIDARAASAREGVSDFDLNYDVLPDALAVIRALGS